MIAGHGFYVLFFCQISLFFYGLLVRRYAVYVAWCYVGQQRREKERLTSTCNWRELGS